METTANICIICKDTNDGGKPTSVIGDRGCKRIYEHAKCLASVFLNLHLDFNTMPTVMATSVLYLINLFYFTCYFQAFMSFYCIKHTMLSFIVFIIVLSNLNKNCI